MSCWSPQDIAKYYENNYKIRAELDKEQIKDNKQALEELRHYKKTLPKFPMSFKNSLTERIAQQQLKDTMISLQIDRISQDARLTPEQIKIRNSQQLTPVDKDLIAFHQSQTRNINPLLANIPKPNFITPPKTDDDWAAINPFFDNRQELHNLNHIKKQINRCMVLIADNTTKLRNTTFNLTKLRLNRKLSDLNTQLTRDIRNSEALTQALDGIDEAKRKYINANITMPNNKALNDYETQLNSLMSGNISRERLPHESDEDYIHRVDTIIQSNIQADNKINANVYVNSEFIALLESLGIYHEIAEKVNNQVPPQIKESILKTKKLFVDEINKIKSKDVPLYKLSTKDILNFIDFYDSKNTIAHKKIIPTAPILVNPTLSSSSSHEFQPNQALPIYEYDSHEIDDEPNTLFFDSLPDDSNTTEPFDINHELSVSDLNSSSTHQSSSPTKFSKLNLMQLKAVGKILGLKTGDLTRNKKPLSQFISSKYSSDAISRAISEYLMANSSSSSLGEGLHHNVSRKSSLNNLKNRLELIEGEVYAGNDNDRLLVEAEHILTQMIKLKVIDRKGAIKYYTQLKNYNA